MKGGYWIWIMLIIAVVWLCIQGLVFLSRRTRRIGFVSRIYEKNKQLGRLVSLFPLAICLPFGLINGVTVLVVFIHLFVFWVMCDLIGFCINKIRKRERGKHYINGFIAIGLTAIYLGIVAILPILLGMVKGFEAYSIGGTSVIIVVGVALETVQAMEAQMLMRHYKGFLE